ncbi:MAG TPA: formate dehydrogenase accessory sulfurtransferase FdhD [Thermoanaerobaculia bacterium]
MNQTTRVSITRFPRNPGSEAADTVVVEEPLEIRVGQMPVSVTMRTPGDDFDLAAGFLLTESIVPDADQIETVRHWGSPNVVRVDLRPGATLDLQRIKRNFRSTSSCGVCGKVSIDALRVHSCAVKSRFTIAEAVVHNLSSAVRREQKSFEETGAVHAAAIFNAEGTILRLREDIGRHNAVDKVIGSLLREGASLSDTLLFVSGRSSFEILQKAAVARIPMVAAVGAPSSLAIELSEEFGITLLGFVRDGRFNVYSGAERIG